MKLHQAALQDTRLSELMQSHPISIEVMLEYKMLCVGCVFSPYHTVADACREHQVDLTDFCQKLISLSS